MKASNAVLFRNVRFICDRFCLSSASKSSLECSINRSVVEWTFSLILVVVSDIVAGLLPDILLNSDSRHRIINLSTTQRVCT